MRCRIVKWIALGLGGVLCTTTSTAAAIPTAAATTTAALIVAWHALHAKDKRRAICSRCVRVWLPMGLVLDHHLLLYCFVII